MHNMNHTNKYRKVLIRSRSHESESVFSLYKTHDSVRQYKRTNNSLCLLYVGLHSSLQFQIKEASSS